MLSLQPTFYTLRRSQNASQTHPEVISVYQLCLQTGALLGSMMRNAVLVWPESGLWGLPRTHPSAWPHKGMEGTIVDEWIRGYGVRGYRESQVFTTQMIWIQKEANWIWSFTLFSSRETQGSPEILFFTWKARNLVVYLSPIGNTVKSVFVFRANSGNAEIQSTSFSL